jgi:hypothetical protein
MSRIDSQAVIQSVAFAIRAFFNRSQINTIMDQRVDDENRLDVARRLYQAMCVQHPDRFIILVDPHGRLLARSDCRYAPLVEPNTR